MKKIVFVLFLSSLLLINGCTPLQKLELAEFQTNLEEKYPVVSIIVNDTYVGQNIIGCENRCAFYRNNIDYIVLFALREPSIFKRVDIHNAYSKYVFDIKLYKSEEDKSSHFEVAIRHKNEIIKNYGYKINVKSEPFADAVAANKNLVEYFVSLFLADIQRDKIFTKKLN